MRDADTGMVGRSDEIVSGWQALPQAHCVYISLSVRLLVFLTRKRVTGDMEVKKEGALFMCL